MLVTRLVDGARGGNAPHVMHHELVEEVLFHEVSGEDRLVGKVARVVHFGQKPKGQDRRHRLGQAVKRHSRDV